MSSNAGHCVQTVSEHFTVALMRERSVLLHLQLHPVQFSSAVTHLYNFFSPTLSTCLFLPHILSSFCANQQISPLQALSYKSEQTRSGCRDDTPVYCGVMMRQSLLVKSCDIFFKCHKGLCDDDDDEETVCLCVEEKDQNLESV